MLKLLNKLFLFLHEPTASIEAREIALSAGIYKKAVLRRFMRTEAGDPGYQYRLAVIYHGGYYMKHDLDEAIFWYQKAADQGHEGARKQLFLLRSLNAGD